VALCALVAAAAIALPAGAPAGQSSQATSGVVAQVAAGIFHSCAVVDNANLRCWGFSGDGQVGYGDRNAIGDTETPGSVGPVNLGAGRTVKALAAGDYHSCALLDNGSVRCWGFAFEGQLGYGDRNNIGDTEVPGSVGPVKLGAGRTATAITAAGRHTCAVLDNGSVRCWGIGDVGQLGYGNANTIGDNETPDSVDPVNLGAGRTARAISAGGRHTCALLDDNSVKCWGLASNGQLGYGDTNAVQDPSTVGAVDLGAGRTAKAISAGGAHTCAVLDNGSVRCWGLGDTGQLGYGNANTIGDNEAPGSAGPVDLGSGRTAVAISAGAAGTCAVLDDGSVRCWGQGDSGQLGYGNKNNIGDNETPASAGPVNVGSGRTAVAIATYVGHTCARLDNGSVRCWGTGPNGELGYCNRDTIGDDETPAAAGPVELGVPGSPGAACAGPPPQPTPGPTPTAAPTEAPTAAPGATPAGPATPNPIGEFPFDPLSSQAKRAKAMRACLRGVTRRATRRRRLCLRRFGRTPGRVTTLRADATGSRQIKLRFLAPSSDGSNPPAARKYQIKQAFRPIRSARDFRRARPLCKGSCRFDVTDLRAKLTLTITDLRRRRTYFYAIVARDNVSGRPGRRSKTIRVRTR